MAVRSINRIIESGFNAIFRPSEFVAAEQRTYSRSRISALTQFWSLMIVYITNLILYAGPLTLAGFGVRSNVSSPPPLIVSLSGPLGDPVTVWQLLIAFTQNSAYITAMTAVTFITFHIGAILTFNSRGIVQSLHTVVYTSTAYLAGLFTLAWYLATHPNVPAARELVLDVQRKFVFAVIDFLGLSLTLPGGQPESIQVGNLTQQGIYIIVILIVMLLYYLYSLYLGARINHQMGRVNATLTLVIVATAPVLYIMGSAITTIILTGT